MRKVIGFGCIALGFLSLLIAVGFVFYNKYEETQGEKNAEILLEEFQQNILEANQTEPVPEATPEVAPEEAPEVVIQENITGEGSREMGTAPVGNYDGIGIISIPVLNVELPVLTDWTYAKLKKAPCHYYGSCYETDFVIAAHNYRNHFGRLSQLVAGDLVLFTDIEGTVHYYEVVLTETLPPTATEEMLTSGFDLSLYTCTPGGANRVTVRCSRVEGRTS